MPMRAMTACERGVQRGGERDDLGQARLARSRSAARPRPPRWRSRGPSGRGAAASRSRPPGRTAARAGPGAGPTMPTNGVPPGRPRRAQRPQPSRSISRRVALDHGVALGPGGRRAERLDHQGVGVQREEGSPVHVGERSQHEPRRRDDRSGPSGSAAAATPLDGGLGRPAVVGLARGRALDPLDEHHLLGQLVAGDVGRGVLHDGAPRRPSAPSASCTTATTSEPQRSDGRPVTTTSATAGWPGDGPLDLLDEDLLAARS